MKLSTKADFQAALRATESALTPFFADMQRELAGLLAQYAGADGKIPPQRSEELRNKARLIVEKYFIRYKVVAGAEKAKESARLHELMALAQRQMKGATQRQQNELRLRVILLGKRIGILEKHSVIVESIDKNGEGVSRFAKLLTSSLDRVVKAAIGRQRENVREVMQKIGK